MGEGSHSSEFGQNCGYFQLVFVKTSGFHVRPPSDHLSQIRQTDQKDQTSRSAWVWLTNFDKKHAKSCLFTRLLKGITFDF